MSLDKIIVIVLVVCAVAALVAVNLSSRKKAKQAGLEPKNEKQLP